MHMYTIQRVLHNDDDSDVRNSQSTVSHHGLLSSKNDVLFHFLVSGEEDVATSDDAHRDGR